MVVCDCDGCNRGLLVYNQNLPKQTCNAPDKLGHPFVLGLTCRRHCQLYNWPDQKQFSKVFDIKAVYHLSILNFLEQLGGFVVQSTILLLNGVVKKLCLVVLPGLA
jgi:hypothetical protein